MLAIRLESSRLHLVNIFEWVSLGLVCVLLYNKRISWQKDFRSLFLTSSCKRDMRICDRRNRTENISSHLKIIFYFGNSNNPWLLNACLDKNFYEKIVMMILFVIVLVIYFSGISRCLNSYHCMQKVGTWNHSNFLRL